MKEDKKLAGYIFLWYSSLVSNSPLQAAFSEKSLLAALQCQLRSKENGKIWVGEA